MVAAERSERRGEGPSGPIRAERRPTVKLARKHKKTIFALRAVQTLRSAQADHTHRVLTLSVRGRKKLSRTAKMQSFVDVIRLGKKLNTAAFNHISSLFIRSTGAHLTKITLSTCRSYKWSSRDSRRLGGGERGATLFFALATHRKKSQQQIGARGETETRARLSWWRTKQHVRLRGDHLWTSQTNNFWLFLYNRLSLQADEVLPTCYSFLSFCKSFIRAHPKSINLSSATSTVMIHFKKPTAEQNDVTYSDTWLLFYPSEGPFSCFSLLSQVSPTPAVASWEKKNLASADLKGCSTSAFFQPDLLFIF